MSVWKSVKIGDICQTASGGTPNKSFADYYEGGTIPWLMSGEVAQGEIFSAKNFITQKGMANSAAKLFPENSVLIAMYGATAGQVGILRFKAASNQAVCAVLPSKNVLTEFMFYAVLSKQAELISQATGNAQPNISQIKIKNTEIPLPPLPEQRRIVAILDEAFAGLDAMRANAEKNLQNARDLFDSYLNAVFSEKGEGWVERTLEQVCIIDSKLVDPRKSEYLDMPHLGAGNMVSNTGEMIDIKTARDEKLISGKFVFDGSMVLYSKIRPYLMKVCRPDFSGLCSADVYPLAVKNGQTNRDFLFHLLLSDDFTNYAIMGSERAGMPKVNRDHLFAYRAWFPPLAQQVKLARSFDAVSAEARNLESLYRQKLAAIAELKQSILQKAFAGELTAESAKPAAVPQIQAIAANTLTPEFTAKILAFGHDRHLKQQQERTFGRVKGQKLLHLTESIGGVDLGREPMKDAAGPNDFQHMLRAEDWAKAQGFFEFVQLDEGGYRFRKLANYDAMLASAKDALEPFKDKLQSVLNLIIPMNSRQAEVLATVHAAWNNLILDGVAITDRAIIQAAREDWHADKLRIPESEFRDAIQIIREKAIVPDGTAKRVGWQGRLI